MALLLISDLFIDPNLCIRKILQANLDEMDKKLLVEDKSCVLFEFYNNDNRMEVGYQCWIMQEDTKENVEKYIDKEVAVFWPQIKVQPARAMKAAKVKLEPGDWDIFPAIIRAIGGNVYEER